MRSCASSATRSVVQGRWGRRATPISCGVQRWCDIDLDTIPAYKVWRPETVEWAMTVNWVKVNDLVRSSPAEYPTNDHQEALRAAKLSGLSGADLEGVFSLYAEPIGAIPAQVNAGGHRITAMRRQHLRWALGQCLLEDVGETRRRAPRLRPLTASQASPRDVR